MKLQAESLVAATAGPDGRLSPQEIYALIRDLAYFKAEKRGFVPGVELQDWLEAEKEVLERLTPARPG